MDKPIYKRAQQYFAKVAPLTEDVAVLSGHRYSEDDQRITRLALVESGQWRYLAGLPEIVASLVSLVEDGRTVFYALLRTGVLHRWAGSEHSVEVIEPERGFLFSELRQIDSHLYACGWGRQVVRREGKRWVRFDDGLVMPKPTSALISIDGHSDSDVYAVGFGGEIFHHDGGGWSQVESPTNFGLNCVRCFEGVTYIAGYHGLLMRGDTRGWRVLSGQKGQNHLWSIVQGFERIFVSSEYEVFSVDGDVLERVQLPFPEEIAFGTMNVGFKKLWMAASAGLIQFDGREWLLVECPWKEEVADSTDSDDS